MEITNFRFDAKSTGAVLLRPMPEEDKKAIKDICTILNGKSLDSVETILQAVRQNYSQAIFCYGEQTPENFEAFCQKAFKKMKIRRLPYD